jgi:predicted metal-dependent phosphoesterase TrpH
VSLPAESSSAGFIDLHSHTNASDGTLTPAELVAMATHIRLAALSITDHDTFAGYEVALPLAKAAGLDLMRGIELNSRLLVTGAAQPRFVHMLVYFPTHEPSAEFHNWLAEQRAERRERNEKLVQALRDRGVDITLAEVEARGRSLAGRPHFAKLLVEKGYVSNFEEAFRQYLGEEAPSYVERDSKTTEEVIELALKGGGMPVVAHPIRIGLARAVEHDVLARFKKAGLVGLEVCHSDHPPALQAYYRLLADELELLPTGGSDFHGTVKPDVELGSGRAGNVRAPMEFLEGLRRWR